MHEIAKLRNKIVFKKENAKKLHFKLCIDLHVKSFQSVEKKEFSNVKECFCKTKENRNVKVICIYTVMLF